MSHRYLRDQFPDTPKAGRFISLLGDAELDEGAVWEAITDPGARQLGELLWIVDLNRQSLDRVIPDVQIERLQGMFAAAGWQVMTCKWGRRIQALFLQPGGQELRERLEAMPNEEYQRMLRSHPDEVHERLLGRDPYPALRQIVAGLSRLDLSAAVRDLGGHDIRLLLETYREIDPARPTVIFAYTVKGRGLSTEGHPNNHSAQLNESQMEELATLSGMSLQSPWQKFDPGTEEDTACVEAAERLRRPEIRSTDIARLPDFPALELQGRCLDPSRSGTIPFRPETGRPRSVGPGSDSQPGRRILHESWRMDQQDGHLVRWRTTGLVLRRSRTDVEMDRRRTGPAH